jgi:hypothetical protein
MLDDGEDGQRTCRHHRRAREIAPGLTLRLTGHPLGYREKVLSISRLAGMSNKSVPVAHLVTILLALLES